MATSGFVAGMRASASATVPGFAHHLDVRRGLEQGPQARPDDLVVVEEEHAQCHGRHLPIPTKGCYSPKGWRGTSISSPRCGAHAP